MDRDFVQLGGHFPQGLWFRFSALVGVKKPAVKTLIDHPHSFDSGSAQLGT